MLRQDYTQGMPVAKPKRKPLLSQESFAHLPVMIMIISQSHFKFPAEMQRWHIKYHKDMDNPSLPGFQSACSIPEKRIPVGKSHPFLSTPEANDWGGEGWNLPCGLSQGFAFNFKQDPRWTRESEHEGRNKNCTLELQPANLGVHHVPQMSVGHVFHGSVTPGALFTCINYLRMPFLLYAH